MQHLCYYDTLLGRLAIAANDAALTRLYFAGEEPQGEYVLTETPLLVQGAAELQAYLNGERQTFSVPLAPAGTAFQRQVWQALTAIPYGSTQSYQAVAAAVGRPTAARAVGAANHDNPLPIFIPCHRVIGKSGQLTGYRGGLAAKEQLLQLERQHER